MLHDLLYRLRILFRRRRAEEDLEDELRFHLEEQTARLMAAGFTAGAARREAILRLGGIEQAKEECRDSRGLQWWDEGWQNLRYAARALGHNPGFAAVAVVTMMLGVGVNTALFTLVNSVLFRPMPVADPGNFYEAQSNRLLTAADLRLFSESARGVRQLSASRWILPTFADTGRILHGNEVSRNYFQALGIHALLGRVFAPGDDTAQTGTPLVFSHTFWERQFHADPSVVGRTLVIGGRQYTVIGVAKPGFAGTMPLVAAFWTPLPEARTSAVHIYARLSPGYTRGQAEAELTALYNQSRPPGRPDPVLLQSRGTFIPVNPATAALSALLLACVALVLLISCANLANLMLARAAARRREVAVRLSLGAGRARLIRQLLTESVLIASLGGALSLLFSAWLLPAASNALQARLPEMWGYWSLHLVPDFRVFLYTSALCLGAGVFFGLAPALQATRADVSSALKDGGGQGMQWSRSRLRSTLVVAQVALCLVLLINAGLLARSLAHAHGADPRFDTEHAVIVQYDDNVLINSEAKPGSSPSRLLDQLAARPGVTAAAAAVHVPLLSSAPVVVHATADAAPSMPLNQVTEGYFAALSIPIVRGRSFTRPEVLGDAAVIVLSEGAARRLFPTADPLGQVVTTDRPRLVVGLARDTRSVRLAEVDPAYLYTPLPPNRLDKGAHLFVRTSSSSTAALSAVRADVGRLASPTILVYTFELALGYQRLPAQAGALVSLVLGVLALLLASVGIYGVISYAVSQRTREVGIRIALGATRRDVVHLVVAQGMRLVAIGLALGAAGAVPLSYLLRFTLYGVRPLDPVTYGLVPVLLAAVALLAMAGPTLRASRVEPLTALRYE